MRKSSAEPALLGGKPVFKAGVVPQPFEASGRWLGEEERISVLEVLDSGVLTRWGGQKVEELETAWSERMGLRYAIAVSSGSAAIEVGLRALGLGEGGEVITSPITDIGTVIGIVAAGCIPVFADVDFSSGLLTPESIEVAATDMTVAVIPVHLFGQLADTVGMCARSDGRWAVVEDASQAHFSEREGAPAGAIGRVGCFSLQQTKVVTAGEGGIVCTDDEKLAEYAQTYQNKGLAKLSNGELRSLVIGRNYRMAELSAAVARAQLSRVESIIQQRGQTHQIVCDYLAHHEMVRVLAGQEGDRCSWWALAVQFPELPSPVCAKRVEAALRAEGLPMGIGLIGRGPLYQLEPVRSLGEQRGLGLYRERAPDRHGSKAYVGADWFSCHTFSMLWCEGITAADAVGIAQAIEKVGMSLDLICDDR